MEWLGLRKKVQATLNFSSERLGFGITVEIYLAKPQSLNRVHHRQVVVVVVPFIEQHHNNNNATPFTTNNNNNSARDLLQTTPPPPVHLQSSADDGM